MCWDATGAYVCSCSDDTTLRIWDAATGRCLRTLHGHTNYVFSAAFNSQGNMLVSASFDESIRIWDVRTGKCLKVGTQATRLRAAPRRQRTCASSRTIASSVDVGR